MNNIYSSLYWYSPKENLAQRLPSMKQKRYTHFSTFHHNRLYVFGGRTYGEDHMAILNDVEVFDVMNN